MAKHIAWHKMYFGWKRLRTNRKYKDRLFRFLFQEKKDLLDLYNAVNESFYTDPNELEIITLDDVIFMKMKNDLSFMISDQLNLYEHQSTFSPNMPLRGLLYFARQYEGLIVQRKDNMYGSKLVMLPTPKYVVFYNGKDRQEDKSELLLSDAFEAGHGSGCLECRALMLNINRGHNKELMERCRRLWEYSEFVSEVNENLRQNMSPKTAIMKAIDTCIQSGILEDVLLKNRAEVLHMLLTEYDEKKHMRDTYKEGYDEGKQAGYSEGKQAGYSEGKQAGYSEGEQAILEKLVQRKLQQGKKAEVIAQELELEIEVVRKIMTRTE
ncbi:MAG: hypothetical protein HFI41_01085 [Lachnospiraceae bacterium]|nr:hypothetical protein [Lachnospiraceae bacterium]